MSNNWTEEQKNAIFSSGGTVLVAAGAGSGKTSVLVQRVIGRITNKNDPMDLDKFLIVTFTNASAQEMRNRISENLYSLMAKTPSDFNLHRQQMLLKSAPIGTIHGFCHNLIKENFFKLGISPKFRIADSGELVFLKEKALQKTLSYFYELNSKNFIRLADIFSSEKNIDKFSNVINMVYEFCNSLPFPEKWFQEKLNLYEFSCDITVWEEFILSYTRELLDFSVNLIAQCLEITKKFEPLEKTYFALFEEDMLKIKKIRMDLDVNSFHSCAKAASDFSLSRLKPFKNKEYETEKNLIISKRNLVKDVFSDIKKYFISSGEEGFKEDLAEIHCLVKTLFEVTLYFRKELFNLKLSKNILDFTDLEHLTLELLSKREGNEIQKSDIAKEITEKYKEIMIDEYQDINDVQNTIFKLITKGENNLFMVGDVKQSIYKFRQSRPEIFLKKKNSYALYNPSTNSYPSKIILGKNFRSSRSIIESVNFVFGILMSGTSGEIEYTDEEKLFCAADYPNSEEPGVCLKLLDSSLAHTREEEDAAEAEEIAKTILKMISEGYLIYKNGVSRHVTYGDFCVLLRSSNTHAHTYMQKLNSYGVPAWSETNEKFLNTSEISTMMSVLKVIDNPLNDISLAATMLSPVFGFGVDDLSAIRNLQKDVPLYFALKQYAKTKGDDSDIQKFINKINFYRQISGTMPCNELIDYICQDTDYPSICRAMPKGELKKLNVLLLRDYAAKFENEYQKGLSGFLEFIENIKEKKSDLPGASVFSESENSVKVMSIHKSKGLEFPVCILAGCSGKFVRDTDSILMHPELGVGFKLKNPEGTVEYDNIIRKAISLKNKNESVAEELRILYVAMTRAKQKLIIMGCVKDIQKLTEKSLAVSSAEQVPYHIIQNSKSFLEWIILCVSQSALKYKLFKALNIPCECFEEENLLPAPNWDIEFLKYKQDDFEQENNLNEKENFETGVLKLDEKLLEKIKKRIEFKYPFQNIVNLPLKTAASKLSHSGEWQNQIAFSYGASLTHLNEFSDPAAKGTAMHKFMCFADFKNARKNLNSEINSLALKGFILPKEISLLDKPALEKFMNSDLCRRITLSSCVMREFKFSVKLPISHTSFAENLTSEEAKSNYIVVQGAPDCAFLENGKYVIVDYKTDKARTACELYEKYLKQLQIYKYALESTSGLKVKETGVYSFYLSDCYFKI